MVVGYRHIPVAGLELTTARKVSSFLGSLPAESESERMMGEKEIDDQIDLFFRDPAVSPPQAGRFSVLYLLRRDIKQCVDSGQILWPATMAILAGIDLLGKFHAGQDGPGVGGRFRRFISDYFACLSSEDAEIIYQLRNALLHSFGLYAESKGKKYHFTLVYQDIGKLIQTHPQHGDSYLLSITSLYRQFETAIDRYHAQLATDTELKSKFKAMFPRYGAIRVHALWLSDEECD